MSTPDPERPATEGPATQRPAPEHPATERPAPDLAIAFGPRQILGGFALIAALILLLLRRRRGDRSQDR